MKTRSEGYDRETLAVINAWRRLPLTKLACAAQALYVLAIHEGNPGYIREAAQALVDEINKGGGK